VIVTLDEACAVTADPEAPSGVSAEGKPAPIRVKPSARRGAGCCAAEGTPGSPLAMSAAVAMLLLRRRHAAP